MSNESGFAGIVLGASLVAWGMFGYEGAMAVWLLTILYLYVRFT